MMNKPESRIMKAYLAAILWLIPFAANAKISDWFVNAGAEVAIIVKILVVIFASVGIILAGIGVISGIVAKKNKQPLEHQQWYVLGGVLCILLVPMLIGLGDSITGQSTQGAVDSFMNGNNSSNSF